MQNYQFIFDRQDIAVSLNSEGDANHDSTFERSQVSSTSPSGSTSSRPEPERSSLLTTPIGSTSDRLPLPVTSTSASTSVSELSKSFTDPLPTVV